MKRTLFFFSTALVLFCIPADGFAQRRPGLRNERSYGNRYLQNSVERVDKLSGQLKDELDSALDRSRMDGKKREDRINDLAHDFHEAAAQFKDRFDDGRDYRRAETEARRVIDLGFQLDRVIGRRRLGGQVNSKWSQIRSDLRVIQNAYR